MRKFKSILALTMAVLWLPVTMHCALEAFPGLEFLRCASDTPTSSDCKGDECQTVESGLYKIEDNQALILAAVTVVVLFETTLQFQDAPPAAGLVAPVIYPPPELSKAWQFAFRAASPPRAPSFAS